MLKAVVAWPTKYVSGKLLGFCDVGLSLDGSTEGYHMIWTGLKIFQGQNGIQVGLPSKKDEKGKTDEKTGKLVYHPVIKVPNSEEKPNSLGTSFMEDLNQVVAKAYNELGQNSGGSGATPRDKDNVGDTDLPF